MVKHIILWQLKDELSAAEKAEIKANIKTGLEGLAGQIPGLVEVHVNINGLPSSNADLMLDTIIRISWTEQHLILRMSFASIEFFFRIV